MNEKPISADKFSPQRPLFIHQLDNRLALWRVENPKFHKKPIYYIENQKNDIRLIVNLDFPDSFALSWETNITIDDFLKHASQLIDKLAEQKHTYRPMETGKGIAVDEMSVKDDNAVNVKTVLPVEPSYSDFGYNNVQIIPWPTSQPIHFDKLVWPLQIDDIVKAGTQETDAPIKIPTNPDEVMIRVNAEFRTLIFNSFDQGLHRPVAYWSHIAPIDDISRIYQETASNPMPEDALKNVIKDLISPIR